MTKNKRKAQPRPEGTTTLKIYPPIDKHYDVMHRIQGWRKKNGNHISIGRLYVEFAIERAEEYLKENNI